jgi:hypothetical protein
MLGASWACDFLVWMGFVCWVYGRDYLLLQTLFCLFSSRRIALSTPTQSSLGLLESSLTLVLSVFNLPLLASPSLVQLSSSPLYASQRQLLEGPPPTVKTSTLEPSRNVKRHAPYRQEGGRKIDEAAVL